MGTQNYTFLNYEVCFTGLLKFDCHGSVHFQPEQAAGFSFIHGNFEVSAGAEQGQHLTFRHILVGFADMRDPVTGRTERNDKFPVFHNLPEKFLRDVCKRILIIVDEDYISFDGISVDHGLQGNFLQEVLLGMAQLFEWQTLCHMGSSLDKDITGWEGKVIRILDDIDFYNGFGWFIKDE